MLVGVVGLSNVSMYVFVSMILVSLCMEILFTSVMPCSLRCGRIFSKEHNVRPGDFITPFEKFRVGWGYVFMLSFPNCFHFSIFSDCLWFVVCIIMVFIAFLILIDLQCVHPCAEVHILQLQPTGRFTSWTKRRKPTKNREGKKRQNTDLIQQNIRRGLWYFGTVCVCGYCENLWKSKTATKMLTHHSAQIPVSAWSSPSLLLCCLLTARDPFLLGLFNRVLDSTDKSFLTSSPRSSCRFMCAQLFVRFWRED